MTVPLDNMYHVRQQSSKDLGYNGFLTAPAIVQQDPFSTMFVDRGNPPCGSSPMLGSRSPSFLDLDCNNTPSNAVPHTQQPSSNGIAPLGWMGCMDSSRQHSWSPGASLAPSFFGSSDHPYHHISSLPHTKMCSTDSAGMSSETLALSTQNIPRSISDLSSSTCAGTPESLTTTSTYSTVQSLQSTQACEESQARCGSEPAQRLLGLSPEMQKQHTFDNTVRTQVSDACVLATSGGAVLQNLLATATDAQRHMSTAAGNGMPMPAMEHQPGFPCDGGPDFGEHAPNTRNPFVPIDGASNAMDAAALEALLPTNVDCAALGVPVENGGPGRRLPRLVATVRYALEEWRSWERAGFPLD